MNSRWPAILFAAGILAASAPAFAQSGECATDADCPDGFACEVGATDACPPCIQGEECPPCDTSSTSWCVPPPPEQCDSANPCSGDDVCVTYTFESCTGEGFACSSEDPDCMPPDPQPEPTCETSSESFCVPPYLAPCQTDTDCGSGFTCEAIEVCECSGSGGMTGTDGEPTEPVDESCSCSPTGDNYCQLIEVECTSDADCASGLTCQELYGGEDVPVTCVPNEDCTQPEPVDPKSYCAPPDYGYYGGPVAYEEGVAEATGRSDADVTSSQREEFFPVDGGSGGSGDKGSPSACSTTGTGSGGSLLILLGGLLFGRLRRRR